MAEIDLTKAHIQMLLNLVQGKSVKIVNPDEFDAWQVIESRLLDYLSGPGLDLGGEE